MTHRNGVRSTLLRAVLVASATAVSLPALAAHPVGAHSHTAAHSAARVSTQPAVTHGRHPTPGGTHSGANKTEAVSRVSHRGAHRAERVTPATRTHALDAKSRAKNSVATAKTHRRGHEPAAEADLPVLSRVRGGKGKSARIASRREVAAERQFAVRATSKRSRSLPERTAEARASTRMPVAPLQEDAPPVSSAPDTPILPGGHDRTVHHPHVPGSQPADTGAAVSQNHSPATTDDFVRAARGSAAIPLLTTDDPDSGIPAHAKALHVFSAPRAASPATIAAPVRERRSAPSRAVLAAESDSGLPDAAVATRPRSRVVSSTTAARTLMPADRAEEREIVTAAMTPAVLPRLLTAGGRMVVLPPMKGTRDILVHQNLMANSEGLERIRNDADLDRMRAAHLLVPIVSTPTLEVNGELPMNRRYARPWTASFTGDISRAYYSRFGQALRLNSAVRTVEYQLRLQRVNGNAASIEGDTASPHLTGQAIDFGKRGMNSQQIAWMRQYLTPLMAAGQLDVEEEFQQACFHISVYRSYVPAVRMPHSEFASATPRAGRVFPGIRDLTDAVAGLPVASDLVTDPQTEK